MARRGLDHMSAWILAIVVSGTVFGGGYVLVRVAARGGGDSGHGGSHDGGGHETSAHESGGHEAPAHESGGHEAPAHESGGHETPAHESGGHETPAHEGRETSAHEGGGHEAPAHEGGGHEAPAHDGGGEAHGSASHAGEGNSKGDEHGKAEHGKAEHGEEHGKSEHGEEHGEEHRKSEHSEERGKSEPAEQHGALPAWDYKGSAGPEHWAELGEAFAKCGRGRQQSPVDIDAPNNTPKLLPIRFNYKPAEVAIQHNGHTIQVDYPLGNYIELEGERFDLVHFQFHAPSEHKVAGIPYDFELHFVHKSAEGKLAVVGILFEEGGSQRALEAILEAMPHEKGVALDHLTVDPNAFLPKKRTFYTYNGSLTTPPCTEGVKWLVLSQPTEIAAKQVDAFVANVSFNARPVQALNGRQVLKSTR